MWLIPVPFGGSSLLAPALTDNYEEREGHEDQLLLFFFVIFAPFVIRITAGALLALPADGAGQERRLADGRQRLDRRLVGW